MELFIAWLVWFVALCAAMVSTWLLIDPDPNTDNTDAEENAG